MMARLRPRAVVLDIMLRGEETWEWLARTKASEATQNIPVIVISTVEERQKGLALGADTYKLAFGHHGGNHPVRHEATGRAAESQASLERAGPWPGPLVARFSPLIGLGAGICAGGRLRPVLMLTFIPQYHSTAGLRVNALRRTGYPRMGILHRRRITIRRWRRRQCRH